MPHPILQGLLVIALIALAGCELLNPKHGNSTDSPESSSSSANSTSKTARVAKPPIAVLDPKNFTKAKARHKQALLAVSKQPLSGADVGYYMDVQKAQLIQVLHDANVEIRYQDSQIILNLPGADSFDSDSVSLLSGAQQYLRSISQVLVEFKNTQITVHGHTDDVGEEKYNQSLSERRALTVARYLLKSGISKQRIAIVGYGESRPVALNSTPTARAKNRRVELHLDPIAN